MPHDRAVAIWLFALWALVLAMVVVGGVTRLTGSGLSMVQWRPLMGALPPISEADWQEVFGLYQQSPQFQLVNDWMGLSDFKRIFLWEYVHRLLGRLVGFAFAVPFVYFLVRRRLTTSAALRVGLAFFLGGAQGLLGWYMVKSGLSDRPEVSHLRLAAHLSLAFTVGMYLWWLAFSAWQAPTQRSQPGPGWLFLLSLAFWPLLALQIVYGAFMAGTHAGLLFATFPQMNGTLLPAPFFRYPSLLDNLVNNPLAIHWVHRILGFVVAGVVALLVGVVWRATENRAARRSAAVVGLLTVMQIALGAGTVMMGVPTGVAVAHQACAYLLLSAAVALTYFMRPLQ